MGATSIKTYTIIFLKFLKKLRKSYCKIIFLLSYERNFQKVNLIAFRSLHNLENPRHTRNVSRKEVVNRVDLNSNVTMMNVDNKPDTD